jgi:hypothetical protein
MQTFNPEEPIPEYLLNDPNAGYEKAEMDQLRAALKRTDKERFLMMTTLMKFNAMMKRAKIIHQPPHSQ